jgi:hypothetical protein
MTWRWEESLGGKGDEAELDVELAKKSRSWPRDSAGQQPISVGRLLPLSTTRTTSSFIHKSNTCNYSRTD